MPQPWTPLLALALIPGFLGCCPDSCDDCVEPVVAEAPRSGIGAGIAGLNGFVENRGQWPDEVLFFARRGGVEATVLRDALVFRPVPRSEDEPAPAPLVLHLPGEPVGREVEGLDRLVTKHHFLVGDRHASDAAGFHRVALHDVLPGVDVVLRNDGGAFEYDLVLEPKASLEDFVVEVEGATALDVRQPHVLMINTEAGEVEQRIRASWQGEEREAVACCFRILQPRDGKQRFGFEAPEWDRGLALVLDPSLLWATYVGGAGNDLTCDLEVDSNGAFYVLGQGANGAPTTPGSLQPIYPPNNSAWIGKLSPDGATLEWATFLGGSDTEDVTAIEVDSAGSVFVLGRTWSQDFPTTPGSYQPAFASLPGKSDTFVARISPDGSSLVWSTFFGGPNSEITEDLALYPNGDVLVVGYGINSGDVPITSAAFDSHYDIEDRLLFRLSANGSQLIFSTFYPAAIRTVLVDQNSSVYVAGGGGPDAPVSSDAFQSTYVVGGSGYIACFDSNVTALRWGTYLGGITGSDTIQSVAVDAAGAVYVEGLTHSIDFPVTGSAFSQTLGGASDGFVAKLLPYGTDLIWSSYLGIPEGNDQTVGLAIDVAGNAHVVGYANEPGWPTTPDAYQTTFTGPTPSTDAAFTKFDALGEALVYSTWFGGSSSEVAVDIELWHDHVYLASYSSGSSSPVTPGVYQPVFKGGLDHHIAAFQLSTLPWRVLSGGHKGTKDVPILAGVGPLTPASPTHLSLRGALPSAPGWIVGGFSSISLPFLGGTLVPYPNVYAPIVATPSGSLEVTFPWPSLSSGTSLVAQVWFFDPGASQGWSASNAVEMIGQ